MADAKSKRFRLNLVNAAEDVPRLIRAYGRACDGEFALVLRPREQRGALVLMTKKDGARVWRSSAQDAPGMPTGSIEPAEAVALVKGEQKGLVKAGPITLRGQWAGYLHCDGGAPRVELVRKLAAYGTLTITSGSAGWTWRVQRTEKWFSQPGADTGTAATLLKAIEAGLARAMGLLGEACSVRDSRRRAALDTAYGADHPIKPAREGKNPTERLKEPRSRKKAAPPRPITAPVSLPDAPATPTALKRLADEVTTEADSLAKGSGRTWTWSESTIQEQAYAWFVSVGLEELSEAISAYDGSPEQPLPGFLESLHEQVRSLDMEPAIQQEALGWLARLGASWQEAPVLMERARKLIRYAQRMVESRLCTGKEKKEAVEAIQRAEQAYEEARAAIVAGQAVDGIRTLRRIGERVALAAAKVARSCAAGQQSFTAAIPEVPPPAAPATAKPKRGRKPRQAAPPSPAAPSEVDAEKDKVLLDAFTAAIQAAMKEVA